LLPRVVILGFAVIAALLSTVLYNFVSISPLAYWTLLLMNLVAFALAIPRQFYTKKFFQALTEAPKAFAIMVGLLFKLKGANKTFIHTPHQHVEPSLNNPTVF